MTIRQMAINLRSWLSIPVQRHMASCQQGAVLMMTIIAVTIAASLGTAIYSFVSTSALTQVGSMNDTKAYYLAESGGHYAIKRLVAIESSEITAQDPDRDNLRAELIASPYTITNAGTFAFPSFIHTSANGFINYSFISKGTPPNSSISRTINYIISVPDIKGVTIPFDGADKILNDDNWNVAGDVSLNDGKDTVRLNKDSVETQVSLDWDKEASTLPDLYDVWNGGNQMLSYEVQVKVNLSSSNDVASGISFRLATQEDTDFGNDSFYGVSYVYCKDGSDLSEFCGADSDKTYVVLWKQASDGAKTVIGKQLASSVSSSLVNSDKLVNWATLVVRIQEQLDPVSGSRENLIYVFAGDPDTNPKGMIHWDYTKYAVVQWQTAFSGTDCSGGQKSFVADTDFLTTDFKTKRDASIKIQDEIGIHALGGASAELADLALRFNLNGGGATTCVAE